jgi:hypothetical protein
MHLSRQKHDTTTNTTDTMVTTKVSDWRSSS